MRELHSPNSLERLRPDFFERHTVGVAKDLLGKVLIVRSSSKYDWRDPRAEVTAGRIVETEAYRAGDPASHSSRGKTPRSSIMFGEPGVAYIYLIYGMYEMLNFVTEPQGSPGAVLIRAIEPLWGEELMKQRRAGKSRLEWTRGPGKLCRAMGITMKLNGESLSGGYLSIRDDGFRPNGIACSPRIGISVGKDLLWRFFIPDHPYVSHERKNV